MRFLLDVHIATSIARTLSSLGHEVVRASDEYADWSDERLLDLAKRDCDFSDLIFGKGVPAPPAILYLCDPSLQPGIAERLPIILANTDIDGHMVVIQRVNIRLRPLPGKSADNG